MRLCEVTGLVSRRDSANRRAQWGILRSNAWPSGHNRPMTDLRPTFRDACLVDGPAGYLGAVRRDGHVWSALRFGVTAGEQPAHGFATREEAGKYLLELDRQDSARGAHHLP